MDFSIDEELKATAKSSAKKILEYDIYKLCLILGVNPSTMSVNDGIIEWYPTLEEGDKNYMVELQLRKLLDAYQLLI
jgi:hypothetical protein